MSKRVFYPLIIALHFAFSFSPLAADDWPSYLGIDRDGHSRETGLSFDDPTVLWTAEVGTGFASCSVVDGKIYTMGSDGETDTVWCLDADTGKEIWTHRYPCKLLNRLHEGGPATTPTVAGDLVYTCSKEGHLFALDRQTGDVKWQLDLRERFDVPMPEWGFSGSPWIARDRLILDAGPLVALNANTGETVWKTRNFTVGYGSPLAFTHNGTDYYAVLNNDGLLVVEAAEGQEITFRKWETSYETNGTTPFYHNGQLFISTAYNRGCTLLDFDGKTLTKVYEHKDMRNHMANSIFLDGHFYGIDRKAHNTRLVTLACMEAKTGEIKWREKNLGCGSLIIAQNHLIILSEDGQLVIAKATPDRFDEVSRTPILKRRCWTPPTLSNGRLYARNSNGTLVCLSLRP